MLPAIHRRWERAHVTWITAPAAASLFWANPLVDRVLPFTGGLPLPLAVESFDVVLNPDADVTCCTLAHAARGRLKIGFDLDPDRGVARPLGPGAEVWFEMGVRDDLKQANTSTYQDLIANVLELDYRREPPILDVSEHDRAKGAELRLAAGSGGKVVGLVTGAGRRWRFKRWTDAGMEALVKRLVAEGHTVFLLGGPEEVERQRRLAALGAGVIDTGCDNSLLQYAGVVNACDVIVTGDTLSLHVAVARSKPVVALFGPTSSVEIDLFDRGEHIVPDLDCLVCYKPDCDFVPNCMESIDVDTVHAAVLRCLDAVPS
jgi:heptosyltransferase-2